MARLLKSGGEACRELESCIHLFGGSLSRFLCTLFDTRDGALLLPHTLRPTA